MQRVEQLQALRAGYLDDAGSQLARLDDFPLPVLQGLLAMVGSGQQEGSNLFPRRR